MSVQHGVQLVGQVIEHVADVVQNGSCRPHLVRSTGVKEWRHKCTLLTMQTQKRRKLPYSLKAAVTPDNYQSKVQTKCFSCCGKGSHAGENESTVILT